MRGALQRALPQRCVLCAAASAKAIVCEACRSDMPTIGEACPRCALPSPRSAVCGACLSTPPAFDLTFAAWRYAFPADRLLQALKYGGRLALAEPLAQALALAIRARDAPLPDRIVAMPLSKRRQRERGFNHAHEIGRYVASSLDIPLGNDLARKRDAPPQAGLSKRERVANVRGAFDADADVAGRAIALVDDVMTTGATIEAAARALKKAGAIRVDAWVVARTVR
ncbi:MAG TPA: ComF family protein [Casimicrobiaceae bacterium]|nr:ComF family protein [Casimicrobiaceae bacterium]